MIKPINSIRMGKSLDILHIQRVIVFIRKYLGVCFTIKIK